jgi:hypothetical protein
MRRLIACVIVAGCGGGGGGGTPGTDAAHQECVDYTNMYRVGAGRPEVTRSDVLEAYADEGAEHDFGTQAHDHFGTTNGGGIAFAENECPHWDLSFGGGDLVMLVDACIDAYVAEGPGGGHYENLMGNYGTLGCGIYQEGTDVTILQDFGQ